MTTGPRTVTSVLRIFCAVLLLSLGLGHQPGSAAPLESFGEEYRLPDGTFADICAEGEHRREPAAKPLCEVCLLAASVILPPPNDETWLAGGQRSHAKALPRPVETFGASAVERPRSRAPPASI
ncbi:hypothetical protein EDE05_12263 [Neorhizobium sp. R1-B]|jgi:hypothetical protein|uniref:hypothetical protein n=1 Tax=Neorhizobium TaxID=1525371 RepID=UPI000CF9682F|nr:MULTISPECIES: hypothetical protein [Neorhizobium]TCV61342.1 hypothetical protein EDE09_12663 [Neorhizobium sp. S3-V5DH]TDX74237.1 hypothetical protein EDE05_12263 [Neorhizobium sp. R1-B]